MMRILGSMVARNEEHRYLDACLDWHLEFLDGVHIFDDQSTDGTREMALTRRNAWVDQRADTEASFMEHEGDFRQAAWEAFEMTMQPVPGDWVLSIDADEFFCSPAEDERVALTVLAMFARAQDANAVNVRIDEIFGICDDIPMKRIDGFWGSIAAPRLFAYNAGGHFANRRMGCGSTPTYVRPVSAVTLMPSILHYGYAAEPDRHTKYARYTSVSSGHNSRHVESILRPPTLEALTGDRWPSL